MQNLCPYAQTNQFRGQADFNRSDLSTSFVHILCKKDGGKLDMCEHCNALRAVLTELAGEKVADVVMKRAEARLHGAATGMPASKNILVVTA